MLEILKTQFFSLSNTKNPPLRQKMGLAARAYAEENFGIEKVVQKHLEIYKAFN